MIAVTAGHVAMLANKLREQQDISRELLEALKRMMPVPITGNPSTKQLRDHWEYEKREGNGAAEDVLFAMDAIAKAEAQ